MTNRPDATLRGCVARVRELCRELGLTQYELWHRVAPLHAIGVEQFRLVLKGRRRPRQWHRLLRAIALAFAEEDCRPLPAATKQRRYLERIFDGEVSGSKYRVQPFADFVTSGSSWLDLTERLIALDYSAIVGLTPETEGSLEQWRPMHELLSDCGQLLIAPDGELAGYWFYVPLTASAMDKAKSGYMFETDIHFDSVIPLGLNGFIQIYLVVMVLAPKYQRIIARSALIGSFMRHLEDLSELGFFIKDLCFCAYTIQSERMAQGLQLQRVARHVSYERFDPDGQRRPASVFVGTAADIARSERIESHWPLLASRYREILER
jgi:hypothetical protein